MLLVLVSVVEREKRRNKIPPILLEQSLGFYGGESDREIIFTTSAWNNINN